MKDSLKGTTTTDKIEWQNSLSAYHEPCGIIILEIKSETTHFLTFACNYPKDHDGDCILNLSWGDTEIELRKKREVDRHD